ncbi:hypothetical protein [Pseudomonas fluorescens]|uniref:Phage abortive infection protein n=1 Tax=Pseudomonas fluorescens TaxID=294 RepID=A0A0F4TK64_PSEFL|nr:hypothetical protein [Pseudomonas fluorescens]KJZ44856.1 hypothetical protein VC35_16540 [Pseudomonas fluorescens]
MNRKFLLIVVAGAIAVIVAIVGMYINMFGGIRSDQAVWGTFGDYFGGILNPVFALLAFLGVLWSLDLQMRQIRQLELDKKADEILQVVKDIDARLTELLQTLVGADSGHDVLVIHMVAEANRLCKQEGGSHTKFLAAVDIYMDFLKASKSSDSLIGMAVREMADQVTTMCEFLKRYPQQQGGGYAPIIEYYTDKTSRLIPMLVDAESLSGSTQAFFKAEIRSS